MRQRMAVFLAVLAAVIVAAQSVWAEAPALAECILQQSPFAPRDTSFFVPQVYGAPPTEPAPERPVDEAQLRRLIRRTLHRRFHGDYWKVAQGLAVFDSAEIAAIVPDPRLRTGLVLLSGTAGEGAIEAIQDGIYGQLRFGIPPSGGSLIAEVVERPDGTLEIIFNEKYQYEDPRLFSPTLVHETLEQDQLEENKEELIVTAAEDLTYGQFLLETPQLAHSRTELSRRANTELMALLNSRDEEGHIRLLVSRGNVFPGGSIALEYFAALFEPLGADTPGNETLERLLEAVTRLALNSPDFDDATVNLLDQNINLFSPAQWVFIAHALKLDLRPASQECLVTDWLGNY
jgi:hypothetical protein